MISFFKLTIFGLAMVALSPMRSGTEKPPINNDQHLILFLSGDVMTGRGIDQVLPHPSDPLLKEPFVKSAMEYVALAERASGRFVTPVDISYIWGDAQDEWKRRSPDLKIINLETSITNSSDFWNEKVVHYRMSPKNIPVLVSGGIDFCSLANNHILDFGYSGLEETLETLENFKIKAAGAGRSLREAATPALFHRKGKTVAVFSYGFESSGIPVEWAAKEGRPGVNFLSDLSQKGVEAIRQKIRETTRPEDFVIASIHWGSNWGYEISTAETEFAHRLIDDAGVDLLHGHSSHHVKAIEVYNKKLILYGCGDFITDYEGIKGYELYRGDLSLMYFVSIDLRTGNLTRLQMTPTKMRRFRVSRADDSEAMWVKDRLSREGRRFGTRVDFGKDKSLELFWN